MRTAIAIALALASTVAMAEEIGQECAAPAGCTASIRTWHLLTITEGGTVTLLKELTKHECEFAMHRAKGQPATNEEIAAAEKRAVADSAYWVKELLRQEQFCAEHPNKSFDYGDIVNGNIMCSDGKVSGRSSRGNGYSYTITPGTIKSAECFE